ncbi:MAG TPA: type II secretion system minor pseudopilin GspK [Burkholderiales bacterium]|nr:type II secretion system minor pseudopilin GspK [Burkholderiales bacterium]
MKKHQRGAAVIVAILIAMLAASTAAFAIWQQSLWVRQLENISDRAKADQLAAGAIDVARDALREDPDLNVDHSGEAWAKNLTLPAEGATVTGQITDQQGRFNLNSLVRASAAAQGNPQRMPNPQAVETFQRLLTNLSLSPDLATAVADWLKNDPADGSVDLDYLARDPAERTAQRNMVDVSELARIKGFNEEIVRTLLPHVTALSQEKPINVNSATVPVLAAVFNDPGLAKSLHSRGESNPFKTMAQVQELLPKDFNCPNCFGVKSDYYAVTVRVQSGRIESGYTAMLRRDQPSPAWPAILWRKDAAD